MLVSLAARERASFLVLALIVLSPSVVMDLAFFTGAALAVFAPVKGELLQTSPFYTLPRRVCCS